MHTVQPKKLKLKAYVIQIIQKKAQGEKNKQRRKIENIKNDRS